MVTLGSLGSTQPPRLFTSQEQSASRSSEISGREHAGPSGYWSSAFDSRAVRIPDATPLSEAASTSIRTWDDEIGAIKSLLATAQARRNALVACSSLPPELLSHVFELLALAEEAQPGLLRCHASWIRVTQVCRVWRHVALSHGVLWSRLVTNSNQPWNVHLQRAGRSPLSIKGSVSSHTTFAHLIAEHLPHTRSLSLDTQDSSIADLIAGAASAVELHSLNLSSNRWCKHPHIDEHQSTLPPTFFTNVAPNLRRVVLRGFDFPWSAVATNIHTLSVQVAPFHTEALRHLEPPAFSTTDILLCLRRMPLLERLSLAYLRVIPSTTITTEIVGLPHLVDLELSGATRQCVDLWKLIQPHSRASIQLNGEDAEELEATSQDIISTLSRHLSATDHPMFTEMIGSMLPQRPSIVLGAPLPEVGDRELLARIPGQQPGVTLRLRDLPSTSNPYSTASFYASLPLGSLLHLSIQNVCTWSTGDWTSVLSPAKAVMDLSITSLVHSENTIAAFFSVLTPVSKDATPRSDTDEAEGRHPRLGDLPVPISPILPSLQTLAFMGINFCSQATPECPALIESLIDMVEARYKAGHPLRTLSLDSCSILSESVARLSYLIEEVRWDGFRGSVSDDEESDDYHDGWNFFDPFDMGVGDDENDVVLWGGFYF